MVKPSMIKRAGLGKRMLAVVSLVFVVTGISQAGDGFKDNYANISPYVITPAPKPRQKAVLKKGKFLVAGRGLNGSIFSGTVILLTEYGWHGAAGLVINRPSKIKISGALPDLKGAKGRGDPVYWGGPVSIEQTMFLFRSSSAPEGAAHIFGDVYAGTSRALLERLFGAGDLKAIHVYAGYAGWAPRQLEQELLRGGWRVMDADAGLVFGEDTAGVWKGLIDAP